MPPPGIIEALDIVEHIGSRLVASSICPARGPFGLERGEEALHDGIVPHVAGPAHAAGNAMVGQQALELFAGVLGRFKWSSQRLMRSYDDQMEASLRSFR